MRARLAVAILSLGLIYASTCSATCAICLGAATPATAHNSTACDHAAPGAAGGAQQRCPAKRDCVGQHHANFEFVQGDGLMRLQFSATSHAHASHLLAGVVGATAGTESASFLSDLAPPPHAAIFPQQMISILRI